MNVNKALEEAISHSGTTKYAITKRIGKSGSYVYNVFQRNANPAISTVVSIANACEYDVMLVSRKDGHRVIVDTTE